MTPPKVGDVIRVPGPDGFIVVRVDTLDGDRITGVTPISVGITGGEVQS